MAPALHAPENISLDTPRIYPYHVTHQLYDQGVFRLDLRNISAAQPSQTTMAGRTPDLRRNRDHPLDPDRADHGAVRDRLDHRRPRARPDRSRFGAWHDHGDIRHALRTDGADRRQRTLARQGADGHRRARD